MDGDDVTKREKTLWAEMAALTEPLCAGKAPGGCKAPHSCCDPMYCQQAFDIARELKEKLEPTGFNKILPLMGPNGCVAPPHLRPICTVHVCCIQGFGFNPDDPGWTREYFKLRKKLERTLIAIS